VVVSYTDGHGTAETVISALSATIANVNDAPAGAVTINGTATEDQILTADTTTLTDADGVGTLHYQWQRGNGASFDNVGLDQATYALGDADVGATLRVVVSYTDGQGTAESVTSAPTAAVANVNDAPAGAVTIAGIATEDQVLTADTSTLADGDGLGTLHYQWQRSSGSGFGNVGLDQATYTLGDADVGAALRVVVSYTDGQGTAESVTSGATASIANVDDAPVACNDAFTTSETTALSGGSLFADNGAGSDDSDGGSAFSVTAVNGSADHARLRRASHGQRQRHLQLRPQPRIRLSRGAWLRSVEHAHNRSVHLYDHRRDDCDCHHNRQRGGLRRHPPGHCGS
jgi:Bacterial cadherin-like domain